MRKSEQHEFDHLLSCSSGSVFSSMRGTFEGRLRPSSPGGPSVSVTSGCWPASSWACSWDSLFFAFLFSIQGKTRRWKNSWTVQWMRTLNVMANLVSVARHKTPQTLLSQNLLLFPYAWGLHFLFCVAWFSTELTGKQTTKHFKRPVAPVTVVG